MKTLIARVALWMLAAEAAFVAVPALIAPRYFYESFPLGASWVDKLPPFNEHLVSDVGEYNLAFALLFAWAAITLRRSLIVPVCVAFTIAAVAHFLYHVTHLEAFDAGDAIAQTIGLGIVVALPVIAALAAPASPQPKGMT
jgi:hypothetical protein